MEEAIRFAEVYVGEANVAEALSKCDNGDAIIEAIQKADFIFKLKIEEVKIGVLEALSKAF